MSMDVPRWRATYKDAVRNEAAMLKCLGLVQANLANAPDLTLHTRFLQTLQAIPRGGMTGFQSGNLDKMIGEEKRRIEGLTSGATTEK